MRKGLALGIVVALVAVVAGTNFAAATHHPADKMAVAASALEVMHATGSSGDALPLALPQGLGGLDADPSSVTVELLSGTLRTSSPTDLVFRLSAECALWTNVTTVGNDESEAFASVQAWVTIDGVPVQVGSGDTHEPGKVVFCNRTYRVVTAEFDDEDATIRQFLATRSANSFSWVALNVGHGIHQVKAWAELTVQADDDMASAAAAVGKRTLLVEPEKLANDVSL
jgi:hypothetical protein